MHKSEFQFCDPTDWKSWIWPSYPSLLVYVVFECPLICTALWSLGHRQFSYNGKYLTFDQSNYEYVFDNDGDVTALRKVIVNKMMGKIMNFVGYLPCLPILSFFGSKCSVIHNNRYLNGNFYTYRSPCIITFLKRLKFKALNPIPLEWMPTWHPPSISPLFEAWFSLWIWGCCCHFLSHDSGCCTK